MLNTTLSLDQKTSDDILVAGLKIMGRLIDRVVIVIISVSFRFSPEIPGGCRLIPNRCIPSI